MEVFIGVMILILGVILLYAAVTNTQGSLFGLATGTPGPTPAAAAS